MASALTVGQGVGGVILAVVPGRASRWSAVGGDAPPPWIVRLLGGRMLAQAAALEWVRRNRQRDERTALRAGALVDLLHAASMVAAAAFVPRYRRPALVSAGLAFTAASAESSAGGPGGESPE